MDSILDTLSSLGSSAISGDWAGLAKNVIDLFTNLIGSSSSTAEGAEAADAAASAE